MSALLALKRLFFQAEASHQPCFAIQGALFLALVSVCALQPCPHSMLGQEQGVHQLPPLCLGQYPAACSFPEERKPSAGSSHAPSAGTSWGGLKLGFTIQEVLPGGR